MKLKGKKSIITGASRSIGRAIAIAFAKQGADVLISYRSDEKGAQEKLFTLILHKLKMLVFFLIKHRTSWDM